LARQVGIRPSGSYKQASLEPPEEADGGSDGSIAAEGADDKIRIEKTIKSGLKI
jgi:hypothetical protein